MTVKTSATTERVREVRAKTVGKRCTYLRESGRSERRSPETSRAPSGYTSRPCLRYAGAWKALERAAERPRSSGKGRRRDKAGQRA